MRFDRKIAAATILLTLLPALAYIHSFSVVAQSPKTGSYDVSVPGDAMGFYSILAMVSNLKMRNFQFSTSLDSYAPTTMSVDVKNLDVEVSDGMTYHVSVNGLKDFSLSANGLTVLTIQCGNGDVDFMFSSNYHNLDIYGTMKGEVNFGVFIPAFQEYEYSGPLLLLHIRIGTLFTLGDINRDLRVDVRDISSVAKFFGLHVEDIGYKLYLDIDLSGKIDVKDIAIVAMRFGRTD